MLFKPAESWVERDEFSSSFVLAGAAAPLTHFSEANDSQELFGKADNAAAPAMTQVYQTKNVSREDRVGQMPCTPSPCENLFALPDPSKHARPGPGGISRSKSNRKGLEVRFKDVISDIIIFEIEGKFKKKTKECKDSLDMDAEKKSNEIESIERRKMDMEDLKIPWSRYCFVGSLIEKKIKIVNLGPPFLIFLIF